MSGRRDESLLLDDLINAAERLVELSSRTPLGYLGQDRGVNEMVLWNLTVLGEASKRLRPETRRRFADIDWMAMARTRDVIVHHYEGLNWPLIAEIIACDLPRLIPRLVEIRDTLRAEFDAANPG